MLPDLDLERSPGVVVVEDSPGARVSDLNLALRGPIY